MKKYLRKEDVVINWTYPHCPDPFEPTSKSKDLHMLKEPNRLFCGVALGSKMASFSILHRENCWHGRDPCDSWPGWEEPADFHSDSDISYFSRTDNLMHINLYELLGDEEGNTLTLNWERFNSQARFFYFKSHNKHRKSCKKLP